MRTINKNEEVNIFLFSLKVVGSKKDQIIDFIEIKSMS